MGNWARSTAVATAVLCAGLSTPGWAQDDTRVTLGEAVVTQFAGSVTRMAASGAFVETFDPGGIVARVINLSEEVPAFNGQHWLSEPQWPLVQADEVGPVFGVALSDGPDPDIYLAASAAFGLPFADDGTGFATGLWGPDGGPDTIWRVPSDPTQPAEIFAKVSLEGRTNPGAALGDLAFDPYHDLLFVSDLHSGLIHAYSVEDGTLRAVFDHGTEGRVGFLDTETGEQRAFAPAPFAAEPGLDCDVATFTEAPECWGITDFRRRVWGLELHQDPATGEKRLYYATWANRGLGSPDFEETDREERTNAVWSVRITPEGQFDPTSVQREFLAPTPGAAIADFAFSHETPERMVLGLHQGLITGDEAGYGNEDGALDATRLVWERRATGGWQALFDDPDAPEARHLRLALAGIIPAGGVDLRPGAEDEIWITGNNLCAPTAPCRDPATGVLTVTDRVHGLLGMDLRLGDAGTAATILPRSLAIDLDENVDEDGVVDLADLAAGAPGSVGALRIANIFPDPIADIGPLAAAPEGAPGAVASDQALPGAGAMSGEDAPGAGAGSGGAVAAAGAPEALDLVIRKGQAGACVAGQPCQFSAVVTNAGQLPFDGLLTIVEEMPAGWRFGASTPGWTCWLTAGGGPLVSCNRDMALDPGQAVALDIWLTPPAGQGSTVQNCVAVNPVAPPDADRTNDRACIDVTTEAGGLPQGLDLALAKANVTPTLTGPMATAQPACRVGVPCNYSFDLVLTNTGTEPFAGQEVALHDLPPAGWTLTQVEGAGSCQAAAAFVICTVGPDMSLAPGASVLTRVTFATPVHDTAQTYVTRNCASLSHPGGQDANSNNDGDCADLTVDVSDPDAAPAGQLAVDLALSKRFGGQGGLPQAGPGATFVGGCASGAPCDFDIVATNVGTTTVSGTLVIREELPLGWTFLAASEGWTCLPDGANVMECQRSEFALVPGDSVVLTVTLDTGGNGAGDMPENCAEMTVAARDAADQNLDNNRACLTVPFMGPAPDLIVRKTGPEVCERGEICRFMIEVENIGDATFSGPLSFVENDDDVFEISSYASVDPWLCEGDVVLPPVMGQEDQLRPGQLNCTVPTLVLEPGQKTRVQLVLIIGRNLEDTRTHYQNCVRLQGDPDADGKEEEGCHTFRLKPGWDLAITKTPKSPYCYANITDLCSYRFDVRNVSNEPYSGPVSISEEFEPGLGIEYYGHNPSDWTCTTRSDGAFQCDHPPVHLQPGESLPQPLELTIAFSRDVPDDIEVMTNRATVLYKGGPPDGDVSNDTDDAMVILNHSRDRTVTGEAQFGIADLFRYESDAKPVLDLNGDGTITCVGPACTWYAFTITNTGTGIYDGPIRLDIELPEDGLIESVIGNVEGLACKADRWSCDIDSNRAECVPASCHLGPGESAGVRLEVDLLREPLPPIPPEGLKLTTCADLTWQPPTSGDPIEQRPSETATDTACVTTNVMRPDCEAGEAYIAGFGCVVVAAPDLAITKSVIGSCSGKRDCAFRIEVTNNGAAPQPSPITLADSFSAPGAQIVRNTGDANCTAVGGGARCALDVDALAPGETVGFTLDMRLPHGTVGDNCARLLVSDPTDTTPLNRDEVRMLQTRLNALGMNPGPIDGVIGPRTRAAAAQAAAQFGFDGSALSDRRLFDIVLQGGNEIADSNPANNQACVSVRLPACTNGFLVSRTTGNCICPAPKEIRNGSCVTVARPQPSPQPTPRTQPAPQPTPQPTPVPQPDRGQDFGIGDFLELFVPQAPQPAPTPTCPSGQVFSTQAGRCIPKPGQIQPMDPNVLNPDLTPLLNLCPQGYVYNPNTNSCVLEGVHID